MKDNIVKLFVCLLIISVFMIIGYSIAQINEFGEKGTLVMCVGGCILGVLLSMFIFEPQPEMI